MAEVTEILRQGGDYKKVAGHLSEGRVGIAFEELDKLGWIRQIEDAERYKLLAASYLEAVNHQGKGGIPKTALVVSPTHAEAAKVTHAIREGLKTHGKLADEQVVIHAVPAHCAD